MLWNTFTRTRPQDKAVAFRRIHEQWLTRALATPAVFPHIPLRRVSDGGFDALRSRPGGRARAEQWWAAALTRLDQPARGTRN